MEKAGLITDRKRIYELFTDIASGDIAHLEEWLHGIIHESRVPGDAMQAKALMQHLIDQTDGTRFTVAETSDAFEEPYIVYDRVTGEYYQDEDGFTPLFLSKQEAQDKADKINRAFREEKESRVGREPEIAFNDGKETVGSSRKQSVLQALRERQAKLKEQEQIKLAQNPQASRKKGEQEL